MTALFQIPTSLRQVAENVADGFDYAASMKEFIDGLIRCLQAQGGQTTDLPLPIPAALFVKEPPRLDEALHRAHLAGMAEYLAELSGQQPPAWSERPDCFLEVPAYFGGRHARDRTIAETPRAFARRQLFCGRALIKLFTVLGSERKPIVYEH